MPRPPVHMMHRRPPRAALALVMGAIIALAAGGAWAPPAQAAGVQCLRQATAPSAAAGTVVLARPLSAIASGPNVVVIPVGSGWTPSVCDAQSVVSSPQTISVGTGAALVFHGPGFSQGYDNTSWTSSWGAVDVGPGDPVPNIDPGGPTGWTPTEVDVLTQQDSLTTWQSCRNCDLRGVTFDDHRTGIYGIPQSFIGDVSGADLSGARLGGEGPSIYRGWNFTNTNLTDADLHGSDFVSSTFVATIVSGTNFDGASLDAVRFASLRHTAPPSFNQVEIGLGWDYVGCTTFQDTRLLGASFSLRAPNDDDCSTEPLFAGSTVPISWAAASLGKGVDLAQAQYVSSGGHALAGANLRGADLHGVSFLGTPADLENADFDGADLTGTSFRLADLSGATLKNVTAPGAVFADADLAGATFAGAKTSLQGANFVRANLSRASFQSADISRAAFDGALAAGTDFNSVLGTGTIFSGAHIYGDGQAFDAARDLSGADFSNAVLAGSVAGGAGFDLTGVNLSQAKFDTAQCVSCNFTGSTLANVVFSKAYLPGAVFSGAQKLTGVDMAGAWLYCGDLQNSGCPPDPTPNLWDWPLALSVGEFYGPVPFASTNLKGVSLQDVTACPDGLSPSGGGCAGHLVPSSGDAPPLPAACSAAGLGACPTLTSTRWKATPASPVAVTSATPATWATNLAQPGYDVALDDGTLRLVGAGSPQVIAGQADRHCSDPGAACGDGGPATGALLGTPTGIAVGLDGSIYVADPSLHRVRVIGPDAAQASRSARRAALLQHRVHGSSGPAAGEIDTVAGSGDSCTSTAVKACGDGGPATAAALAGPYGVWAAPSGDVFIADGPRGIRQLHPDGTITPIGPAPGQYDVRAVAGDGQGNLYATTRNPDGIIQVDLSSGQTTMVVGTGTSGYNGNRDPDYNTLLPGDEVQVDRPQGLSVALNGNVVFADSGNDLIRAYVPSADHVIDDLGGVVTHGAPQGGDNGDGRYGNLTQLSQPAGVAVTTGAVLVVADTGNGAVRQIGPAPSATSRVLGGAPPLPLARLSCTSTTRRRRSPTARCALPGFARPSQIPGIRAAHVRIVRRGTVYATGRRASHRARHFALVLEQRRRLRPGRYILAVRFGRHGHAHRIALTIGRHSPRPRFTG